MPSLRTQDAHIYYETTGTGPPVLLIQGVGIAGCGWAPQVRALDHHFQLCWFDHRGIGRSSGSPISVKAMAHDSLALMDQLGWHHAHVVGHSMGGVVAQQLALDAPHRVTSLALLCTFSRGRNVIRCGPAAIALQIRCRLGTEAMRRRAFFEMVSPRALHSVNPEAEMDRLEAVFGRRLTAIPSVAFRQVAALRAHDIWDQLEALRHIPSLVVSATEDPLAPPTEGAALAGTLGAHFEEVGGSHAVVVQDAARINGLLRSLWSTTAAEPERGATT